MKLMILDELSKTSQPVHKFNLIGRTGMGGPLDWRLARTLSEDERALAVRAFDELRRSDLIRPTFADLVEPENWVTITDAGRRALDRRTLDDLDEALARISPHLLDVREGAWAALSSGTPDALRQSAHSARELIDQAIKEGAPDSEVLAAAQIESSASKGPLTRRDRLTFLMRKHKGAISQSDVGLAAKTIDLILEIDDKLMAVAHGRSAPKASDVEDCLRMAEISLRRILSSAQ